LQGHRFFAFFTPRRGLDQYGDLHFGQMVGISGVLGYHSCPQRKHRKVGNLKSIRTHYTCR
jgi:hypothetical protein